MLFTEYKKCTLCARRCGVDRYEKRGFCKVTSELLVARAAHHDWEEPLISGTRGSGAIFFSGCSLSCAYCQNRDISRGSFGKVISVERLSEIMLELQESGAHNINLVTPTHFVPSIKSAITLARAGGLSLPIVYNTSGYDTVETIKSLEGYVDVYLPDMKYYLPKTAYELSAATDYPKVAREAIAEMVRQTGECTIDGDGLLKKGTVVRILLLPGHVAEAKLILSYLYEAYGDKIYVSLMNQYTPPEEMKPPLDRRVTREEYRQLVAYAVRLGVKNGFVQEHGTASKSFIPAFDFTGV